MPDLQNTKIIQWSPDSKHEDETFEFDIDGFGIQKIRISKIPKSIVEDFERENPLNAYTGETSEFDILTTSPVLESNKSAQIDTSGSYSEIWLRDPVIDRLPERGDTFSFLFQPVSSGNRIRLFFGSDGTNNETYHVECMERDSKFKIVKRGDNNKEDEKSYNFDIGQIYQVVVSWSEELIESELYKFDIENFEREEDSEELVSINDNSYDNGPICWASSGDSNSDIRFDWLIIEDSA